MAAQYYEGHPYDNYGTYPPRGAPVPTSYPEATYPPPGPVPTGRGAVISRYPLDDPEESYVEEVHRDFPPGAYYDRERRRTVMDGDLVRSRSVGRNGDYHYYKDEDFVRGPRYRHRHRKAKYSPGSSTSSSPSPTRRRRKSLGGQAVGALTGAAAALGLTSRGHSRHRRRHSDDWEDERYYRRGRSYSRSRSRGHHRSLSRKELGRSLTAALTAGAAEAYRARKEPGGWNGEKGKRIMTAALTAGGVDSFLEQGGDGHKKRHILESTLAGLATNHLVNGPRSRSRGGRRARSESRGGFKDVASAGLLAAAGREAYKHYRSRSRSRARRSSDDSDDDGYRSRSRRRGGSRKRSHSVSAYLSKGLAALGLTDDDDYSDRRRSRSRRRRDYSPSDDSYRDYYSTSRSRSRHGPALRDRSRDKYGGNSVSPSRSLPGSGQTLARRQADPAPDRSKRSSSTSSSNSDSDLGSSTDEERMAKKLRRQRLLTTAFAGIATAHAAHGIVTNVEKHKKRRKAMKEGKITPEKVQKLKTKEKLGDLASLGLMAYGLKGVASEWAEAAKHHKEVHEFRTKQKKRRMKRELRRARSFQG